MCISIKEYEHINFDFSILLAGFLLESFREGHARNHRGILTSSNKWHDLIGETYSCSPVFFPGNVALEIDHVA